MRRGLEAMHCFRLPTLSLVLALFGVLVLRRGGVCASGVDGVLSETEGR